MPNLKKFIEKKKGEMLYAAFFISQINQANNWDYVVVSNENEMSEDCDVDVFAKSKKLPTLNLQLKNIDTEHKYRGILRAREAENNSDGESLVQIRDLDSISWIKEAVDRCTMHYEKPRRCNIVLLLHVYHVTKIDEEYAREEFIQYQQSDFKAIYLVNPFGTTQDGQLLAIKALPKN